MAPSPSPTRSTDSQISMLPEPAHALTRDQVVEGLQTSPEDGLSTTDAEQRLQKYGRNQFDEGPGVQPVKILIRQVANAMMLVLVMAMIVSFAIRSWIEGGVVAFVIFLNIAVGFYQEFNAEKTMASLQSLSSPTANVVRDGNTAVLPAGEIVPGDLIELKLGDTVPADIRLLESINLETDEALLTGESLPVAKDEEVTFDADTGPGDRINIAFASSTITKGRGRGVVIGTGMKTEIGMIAAALRKKDSRRRPVKRREDGTAHPLRYPQSWAMTGADAVGRFLGVNVGTPLQKKLSRLALLLFGIAVICAIIVLAANNFSNNTEVIIYAVATGLSMLPASLIVVLTITMAVGTKRMVERHVIVRKMNALEALGGVTDICSDKTGTLTQGRMVAKACWIPASGTYRIAASNEPFNPTMGDLYYAKGSPTEFGDSDANGADYTKAVQESQPLQDFLYIATLANLATVHKDKENVWHARGDPTEIALQVFASRFDYNRSRFQSGDNPKYKQVSEYPFDSSVKKMSVIFEQTETGEQMIYTKGAVERVIESCTHINWGIDNPEIVAFEDHHEKLILESMEALASQGLRVLALASQVHDPSKGRRASRDAPPPREHIEKDLVFRGLIGLYDPPRPESAEAVKNCHRAGIKVRMLTGDHPGTAKAIAHQVGILPDMSLESAPVAKSMIMTAKEFDAFSDAELDALPILPLVIARCAPNTKVRMIEALRRRKAFMGMTGDGVNDSPSLKIADVGIAMGQAGSDVAKDASDIVLTDDNFASILNAIEEGRRMFDNIQKFILHLLAQNIAQACTLLIGLVFKDASGLSVFPLAPVEIMWIIMITSGLPDMGLGMEVAAPDILERPPQNLKRGVFTLEVMFDMLAMGLWMSALCLASFLLVMFAWGDGQFGDQCNASYSLQCDTVFRARATTFVSLTWFSLFLAWEVVDMRRSFFRMQPDSKSPFQWAKDVWRNKFLFWSVMAGFVTIFPVLYIPVINRDVFKHEGITWEWGIVFVEAILFFAGVEFWKWLKRAFFRRRAAKRGETPDDLEKKAFGDYIEDQPALAEAESQEKSDLEK